MPFKDQNNLLGHFNIFFHHKRKKIGQNSKNRNTHEKGVYKHLKVCTHSLLTLEFCANVIAFSSCKDILLSGLTFF